MEQLYIYLALTLFGLVFGSFAGAKVWRLRARQLQQDKDEGVTVNKKEYDRLSVLNKSTSLNDRSRCLQCGYSLKWYDMIPFFSWISLQGKCRKCRKPIGYMELLIELCLAGFFVASYIFWPHSLDNPVHAALFGLWLIAGIGLAILFVYDLFWSLLPDSTNLFLVAIGTINVAALYVASGYDNGVLLSAFWAVITLSGLYLLIYLVSSGKWIGQGDIKLGLGLGLLLADWKLALIALFGANLIGCLVVLPGLISGKLKRDSHVPFGPFLIVGFVVAGLFGQYLLDAYFFRL